MNLIVIEEHQAGDLVFAQVYFLYILLEATSAYVNVPIAKVLLIRLLLPWPVNASIFASYSLLG